MGFRECRCKVPVQSTNPRHPNTCVKCSSHISPNWTSSDTSVRRFFERLAEAILPDYLEKVRRGEVDQWWSVFRGHAEGREIAGRRLYGHRCLSRDNALDGMEEAADGALYALYETLVRRRSGADDDIALALTAAHHFAEAHRHLQALRSREHQPYSDTPQ